MAAETLVEPPPSSLSGVARVLVNAGKLTAKAAEELTKNARERKSSFVAALIGAGTVKPDDLAHTLSIALALPVIDLNAVDLLKLPRNIVDQKIASQYQLLVLGKRGNRLFIGAADPTDQEAAERIKITLRKYDVVARLGGNRFSVLLNEIADPQTIGSICEKLLTAFGRPFELGGLNVHVSISIGASIYPTDGQDSKTLMIASESALYSAKADGRNLYKYYSREMNELGSQLFKLERMLRLALERNEFSVVYQPQVNAGNGRLVGVEALLRWHNPELGQVSPVQFIPVAEETGLIVPIGEWVMREACLQAKRWQTELGVDIPVAVNLSARQFRRNDLLASVQLVLDETGLPSRLLELEITEGLLMVDPIGAIDIIRGLNFLGVKTALDDFGTGYSSLAYLKAFPLNRLKIDRAFVRDLPHNESDCAISNTVITLGLNLNMEVLAEGVETEAQRDFLARSGCQTFQGYLFGKPMPGDDLTQRLHSGEFVAAQRAPAA